MKIGADIVSVLIPCRNEELYIAKVIENILQQDYPRNLLEVFVIDGQSTDNTRNVLHDFSVQFSFIQLIDNPDKAVPHALNKGIQRATGDVIIRLDAHCVYPTNYISCLVDQLHKLQADNVGGVCITTAKNDSVKAKVIAAATSCSFGIGNSQFRLNVDRIKLVDTVPFGCYRREVFAKIGFFDEELIRNQDDEFNGRLIKNGGKIYLIPDVKIIYFARENFTKLTKMFYQYGLFKPLVNKKLGMPATLRQLIPPLFVFFLFCVPIMYFFPTLRLFSVGCILLYLFISLFVSLRICYQKRNYSFLILPYVFFILHFSYGWGYWRGLLRFLVFQKSHKINDLAMSR
jgi:Glycosyltransferases, probably involved in cell wall biogenesis